MLNLIINYYKAILSLSCLFICHLSLDQLKETHAKNPPFKTISLPKIQQQPGLHQSIPDCSLAIGRSGETFFSVT